MSHTPTCDPPCLDAPLCRHREEPDPPVRVLTDVRLLHLSIDATPNAFGYAIEVRDDDEPHIVRSVN